MRFFLFLFLFFGTTLHAQFAPAAGKPGSTALRYDSSCFVAWAKASQLQRGWMDISEPDTGYASVGDSLSATGPAFQNGVVSLGDGGSVTLEFNHPIKNDTGWDFAVFENTFLDSFLELAFVEVSTDGKTFVRFPSESLTDTIIQTSSFGFTRPEKVNNLAGKYIAGYGTPFDLEELKDSNGIDIHKIQFVRIIDVVGSIADKYATRDSKGRKINDPWPTRFPSSGFDLDAVGVIHQDLSAGIQSPRQTSIKCWPNPVLHSEIFWVEASREQILELCDNSGRILRYLPVTRGANPIKIDLASGIYYLRSRDLDAGSVSVMVIQ